MSGRLAGKVAVITGGTSGIGEATAELFVAEGASVAFTGRSREKGAALADRLGPAATYHHADVTKEEDIKASIDFALAQHGRIDVLFNNAGGPAPGNIASMTGEEIDYGVHLLLRSVILGVRHVIEPMKAAGGGSIINNSSVAGIRYNQATALYSVLKAAVTHYTRLAGVELGPHGIRVNAISPGAIATPIFWAAGSGYADLFGEPDQAGKMKTLEGLLEKLTPTPRSGFAMDVAEAALFLASDAGSFVNCHDLVVDGGLVAMFNEQTEQASPG